MSEKNGLSMRKIREILRLKHDCNLSIRQISASTRVSVGAVTKYLQLFVKSGLTWPLPDEADDTFIINKLMPESANNHRKGLIDPDWVEMHRELKRKGMTKQLLWEEYCQIYPHNAYSYAQYCHRYSEWKKKQKRSMRQVHKAGEKLFIDYAGITIPVVNSATGEARQAQIFVAVLGASSYTYAEASWGQSQADFLASHVRAFEFFGGVTDMLVPDNLKSAVIKACRYDPEVNPHYQHLAQHFGVSIMPTRPYKPKDKAKVEVGVQVVERWILMKLRNTFFFSLAELNQEIRRLLEDLNTRAFKQQPGSRRLSYEQLDRPALKPLPSQPFEYLDFKLARVNIDYHIRYKEHAYSVPHALVREQVEIRAGEQLVQILFKGKPVTSHPRKRCSGYTTKPEHMPKSHQKHQEWSPGKLMSWAQKLGPDVLLFTRQLLDSKEHPEQAYRACLGLLNMSRDYGADRLNAACARARHVGGHRIRNVKEILLAGLDQLPLETLDSSDSDRVIINHENIRGAASYE